MTVSFFFFFTCWCWSVLTNLAFSVSQFLPLKYKQKAYRSTEKLLCISPHPPPIPIHRTLMLPFFYRCLQILLEQGAAVNTATQSGDTPLHLAVDGGHLVCCQLLLHHGADIILPGAVSQLQLMRDGRSGSLVMLTLEAIQWQILLFRMFLICYLRQFHPFLTFSAHIFD